ncbi:PAS/PAC sensor signal transduction histidine kinase [Natrialba magadii ATCC 43099]|uniref:histidine kinase n=1 Tax=Natrialba magadii (strain ATCC 43099 / DSM 3394 / CCM 3739 / CIP 104546 / IAM 13178 / JCM 8861 / NBRC 102185 / NCIMB 2190 / MS3) TaxID=547559 RepID=L9UYE4_NATMM|nr:PAS/PAC sensor signal transduction histidine kinase [Natrialba magadii ATCC 43099]
MERYRALARAIDGGLCQCDEHGDIEVVDDRFRSLTGYPGEELTDTHISALFDNAGIAAIDDVLTSPSEDDVVETAVDVQTASGDPLSCTVRVTRVPPAGDAREDELDSVLCFVRERGGGSTVGSEPVPEVDGASERTVELEPESEPEMEPGPESESKPKSESKSPLELTSSETDRASADSIKAALNGASIGAIVLDGSFEIKWIDETAETILGLDRESVLGRPKHAVVEEQLADRVVEPPSFVSQAGYGRRESDEDDETPTDTAGSDNESQHTTDEAPPADTLEFKLVDDRGKRWLEYQSKPIKTGAYAGGRVEFYDDITDRKRSEGQLKKSQEAFNTLVDTVEEYAIFRLDEDGRIISWNEGAHQIKGYDRDEILGEHFSTFYTDEDRAMNVPERNLQAALETGSAEDEGWRVRSDGSQFWANVTITPIRAADGTHQGFLKVTRDMTDRRNREQELETELQRVFNRVSDALYAVDNEFRFTLVNDRAEELLGYPEADLLGESLWDVFPSAAEIDDVWDAFHTARDEQIPTDYELYYPRLGFWVEANLYPSETGISVYFRDVSERKQREQALEESKQRYRTIAEYFPNGVVALFDHDLEYTLAAGQGFEKIDEEPSEIEGASFENTWTPETRDTLEPVLRSALEGDEQSVEFWHDDREWMLYAVPVTDSEGTVFAGMTMAHDITERKENQRKLEETVAQLEESNKRLEQFAYAASHDLQEPLRMVSSYLQLIERRYSDAFDEDGEEFLEYAVDGAERMRRMIDGLLAYSRVETRGDPLEPIDLDDVFANVREDLQLQIAETNAEITVADDGLPRVRGDANQLRQVFQNLLENALEYSGDDRPRIHVDAESRFRDRRREWVISVHDEGIGIESSDQDRVFEVFERLHNPEDHPGTGIGLALCERIVERHGGEMWIESEPGAWTTVSFTVPAA